MQDIPPNKNDGSSLTASLAALSNPDRPYLGDEQVVEDIVRQLAADVFQIASEDGDTKDVEKAVEDTARAFVGEHPDYAGIPDFHGSGQLAATLARHFGYSDADPLGIMKAHFSAFAEKVLKVTEKAFTGTDSEDWQEDFDMLMENFLPTLQGERVAFY